MAQEPNDIIVRVFVSYSHWDEEWLKGHEAGWQDFWYSWKALRRRSDVEFWYDQDRDDGLTCGDDWDNRIKQRLESSDVAVLLLSDSFFNSDYIQRYELPAIERLEQEARMIVFPILVEEAADSDLERLSHKQIMPRPHSKTKEYLSIRRYYEGGISQGDKQLIEIRRHLARVLDLARNQKLAAAPPPVARAAREPVKPQKAETPPSFRKRAAPPVRPPVPAPPRQVVAVQAALLFAPAASGPWRSIVEEGHFQTVPGGSHLVMWVKAGTPLQCFLVVHTEDTQAGPTVLNRLLPRGLWQQLPDQKALIDDSPAVSPTWRVGLLLVEAEAQISQQEVQAMMETPKLAADQRGCKELSAPEARKLRTVEGSEAVQLHGALPMIHWMEVRFDG